MKKLLTIKYNGAKFEGYATQPHKKTVQDKLEEALAIILKKKIKTQAASRTDAKVHALDQKVVVELDILIDNDRLKKALNALLTNYIQVVTVEDVNCDFHPRKNILYKKYVYVLSKEIDPFCVEYKTLLKYNVDLNKMKKASQYLIGEHDFSAFCAAKTDVKTKVRTIYEINIIEKENDIYFEFKGNGFLYNMIRIIVGTLIDVGRGKINCDEIKTILEQKERKNAGMTYPPNGLFLTKVRYCDKIK